jgi:hypothetical protein
VAAYLIMAWVVIGWSLRATLTERTEEARQWLARRFPARWRPGRTYQGLLKATLLVWDWRQGPGNSSERRHLQDMIADLPLLTLLVADAGYVGFDLMKSLIEARVDFLIRCGGNVRLLVEGTYSRIERDGQHWRVYLWPKNRRHEAPLELRLIVLKRRGRRVYLLTTVRQETRLSRRMAAEIYQARWGVEVQFRSLKRTLVHYRVLSKTPAAGAVELAAYVLALALLMLQGAVALGRQVVRLSVAGALRALRDALEALRNRAWAPALEQRLRGALRDEYRRRRPKHSRYWPRKKNDHPPGPPKLHRLTRHETARIAASRNQSSTALG